MATRTRQGAPQRPVPITPPPDRATEYARLVVAGQIITGRFVRLACERHLRDLETAHERGFTWDPAKSEWACDFFRFVAHFEGPKAGRPVELELWQCFTVGSVFGWLRDDGTRRFRRVFEEIAKKNGKSLKAAGIGILVGFFDGEAGAQVYAAATKRDQAKLVWGAAKTMVEKSPKLRTRIKTSAGSIYNPRTRSLFRPLGKETKTEDGINPSAVIIDEIHRHEDRSLIDLLSESFGARANPLLYEITTAGTVGESVWAEEHDYAEKVLEGTIVDDELFAYVANLDRKPDGTLADDPFNPASWIKANPNLGVSVRIDDMASSAAQAQAKPLKLNEFLRLRLNVRTQSITRWILAPEWAANDGAPGPLGGRLAYGGLDLGSRIDLAAFIAIAAHQDDPEALDVFARFWLPEDAVDERSKRDRVPYDTWVREGWIQTTPGNVTDYDKIRLDLNQLAGAGAELEGDEAAADYLDIFEIGFDPHDATQLSTQLAADGLKLVRVMQSTTEMDAAVKEVERLVASRKLRHGGNPVLGWMLANTVMAQDAAGRRKPDKEKAREKIDGVTALLMAIKRWMANAGAEDEWTAA